MTLAAERTQYVDEDEVLAVPRVEGTETWNPIHHGDVIRVLGNVLKANGIGVRRKSYSLGFEGRRMFAVWDLDVDDGEIGYALGIRNSMDKSMALGIVAGTVVFVCDNLAFSGEFIRFRKHTKLIEEDLLLICCEAVEKAQVRLKEFADWHRSLRNYPLSRPDAERLTFQAMELGVIRPTQFHAFYSLYFAEGARYGGGRDLYHWHEAVTDLNRHRSPFQAVAWNDRLNQICKNYIRFGRL